MTRSAGRSIAPWIVAGICATGGLGWLAWRGVFTGSSSLAAAIPASPVVALEDTLVRRNLRVPGDPLLETQYADINARYFASALPAIPVRWEPDLANVGILGDRPFTLEGLFGHRGADSVILLNPMLQANPADVTRALCHEMVHARLFASGDQATDHGPAFQTELRRLAVAGAFAGVPATDEERATLRAWLDAESARLDAERDEVDRLGSDLTTEREAIEHDTATPPTSPPGDPSDTRVDSAADLAARREAYNDRAVEANARLVRDRATLDQFNREVARYNLMLVYPDGLDESSFVKPKAAQTSAPVR